MAGWYIPGDDRTGAHNSAIANGNAFQNQRARPDEDAPANLDWTRDRAAHVRVIAPAPFTDGNVEIVVHDHCARAENGAFADLDGRGGAQDCAAQADPRAEDQPGSRRERHSI